ncbi:hypothetical protein KGM_205690 [Danaus plexippus plexippus]|uniref:CHK kinase-like domain-containing protein n=1 Tax=Danaus plexippus plexippus TaxID=278856 RepID=A0A212FEP4_DANPL|nr:hypothetical protein KGM_205690 [Danaus plexippus plexippus]
MYNKPKADFIKENCFYKKEALIYKIIDEMDETDGNNRWSPKSLIHNDRVLAMLDLSVDGYKSLPVLEYFDRKHVLVGTSAIARFHAAYANYVTKKSTELLEYNIMDDYQLLTTESVFKKCPILYAAAKLSSTFIKEFLKVSDVYPNNLEETVYDVFVKGSESLRERPDTLNVLLHRDLWTNNIMFKYSGEVPIRAILVDYQCVRYGPPAFDLMIFLYLTTSRSFRDLYEKEVFNHYFTVFTNNLNEPTRKRLQKYNYDLEAFLNLCEEARQFALVEALTIFPFVLMDPNTAQVTFDDPTTFTDLIEGDRSAPVMALARRSIQYRKWQLEVCEEFVKQYVNLKDT